MRPTAFRSPSATSRSATDAAGAAIVIRVTGVFCDPRPVLGEDHLAVRWLPLADPAAALELPWIPADLPIVHALLDHLRG